MSRMKPEGRGPRLPLAAMLLIGLSGCSSWNWQEAGRNWLESFCRSQPNMSCHGEERIVRPLSASGDRARG